MARTQRPCRYGGLRAGADAKTLTADKNSTYNRIMRTLVCENKTPLTHISCGQLLSSPGFLHPQRKLDSFVLIVCIKGRLHIAQEERRYTLKENEFIVLFAGREHGGFRPSESELSYLWCHFTIRTDYKIIEHAPSVGNLCREDVLKQGADQKPQRLADVYLLPEQGRVSPEGRVLIIFRQLLDIARTRVYSPMLADYALSLCALEVSQESMVVERGNINPRMEKIIEWLRVNYAKNLSAQELGERFGYNADYLSTAFRSYTGRSLMRFVRDLRLERSRVLLVHTGLTIKEIAWQIGFGDEKAFMRSFKEAMGVTPSTYRTAFARGKIVRE